MEVSMLDEEFLVMERREEEPGDSDAARLRKVGMWLLAQRYPVSWRGPRRYTSVAHSSCRALSRFSWTWATQAKKQRALGCMSIVPPSPLCSSSNSMLICIPLMWERSTGNGSQHRIVVPSSSIAACASASEKEKRWSRMSEWAVGLPNAFRHAFQVLEILPSSGHMRPNLRSSPPS